MAIKTYRPTTPSRRHMSVSGFDGVEKHVRPEKSLVEVLKKNAGRNSYGHITVRHQGGGNRQKYRVIDFKRDKREVEGKVLRLEYDPNRSAYIALVEYADGERRYILAPVGIAAGDAVMASAAADIKPGNALPMANIPVGTVIHNIELYKVRMDCFATIGQVGNIDHANVHIGKAGRKRHMGWRPTVRGSVMNPVDHPHGGGEGKSPVGRPGPVTPWGKPALGYKTRKTKNRTDKFIVKRRNAK